MNSVILCLALNMYHEARGEDIDGMVAVAEVTLNRVESDRYPDDVCEVVKQPYQFSWYISDDKMPPIEEDDVFSEAFIIAKDMIESGNRPFGLSATHFHTRSIRPYWADKFERVATIGNHIFYLE